MPFPSLIMGLIAKTRLKLPSGLTVVQRDVSSIPRDCVEEEGGDTEEEIDRFTTAPETSAQPSSSALARGLDRLDHLITRVE